MSISKTPARQTVRAGEQQPNCFRDFDTRAELVDRVTVRREMICKCGGAVGILKARQGWDGAPSADPLTFTCLSCEMVSEFFNSHRDGYDNIMGNGATSHQGEKIATLVCDRCGSSKFYVISDLLYNIELDEIDEELDGIGNASPADCFDAINVHARCAACEAAVTVGWWELA